MAAPTLFVFGRSIPLGAGAVVQIPPPAAYVTGWNGTLNTSTGETILAADFSKNGLRIAFNLSLRFGFDSATSQWLPQSNQPAQPASSYFRILPQAAPVPAGAICFQHGPLSLTETYFVPSSLVGGADLSLRLQSNPITLGYYNSDQDLPLTLYTDGLLGLQLDDAAPSVFLRDGFFLGMFYALRKVIVGDQFLPMSFFTATAPSAALSIFGPPAGNRLALRFVPPADGTLALHVEHVDRTTPPGPGNPLQAALKASAFEIEIALVPNAAGFPMIDGATLHPQSGTGATGPTLTTHAYADVLNNPAVWEAQAPVPLHIRPFSDHAPSTFLIAGRPESDGLPVRLSAPSDPSDHTAPIHGVAAETKYRIADNAPAGKPHGHIACIAGRNVPTTGLLNPDISREGAGPYFKLEQVPGQASLHITVAKGGHAYVSAAGGSNVVVHDFATTAMALPALPFEFTEAMSVPDGNGGTISLSDAVRGAVKKINAPPPYDLGTSHHENRMGESAVAAGSPVPLDHVFPQLPAGSAVSPVAAAKVKPKLDDYALTRGFGLADVSHHQPGAEEPDYVLLRSGDPGISVANVGKIMLNTPLPGGDAFSTIAGAPNQAVFGLIKLTTAYSLDDIFAREPDLDNVTPFGGQSLLDLIHPEIRSKGWTGLMLFGLPFNFSGSLSGLFQDDLKLAWTSVSPNKNGSNSVSGRISWTNPDLTVAGPMQGGTPEVAVRPRKLDMGFLDGSITQCDAQVDLNIAGTFGLAQPGDGLSVEIDGSYDRQSGTIKLTGNLSTPLELVPDAGFGPFQSVKLKGVTVVHAAPDPSKPGKPTNIIRLAGSMTLKPLQIGSFGLASGNTEIDFNNLDIHVPGIDDSTTWQWCDIGYPNIAIDLDLPHFSIGPLDIKLRSLGLGWNGLDWSRLLSLGSLADPPAAQQTKCFVLGLRLDLMELPELAELDRLKIDFNLGFPSFDGKSWSPGDLRAGLCAVGFDKFSVKLMRFLEIDAQKVTIGPAQYTPPGQPTPTWFKFDGVRVLILGNEVVSNLVLEIFTAGDERGFICYVEPGADVPRNGILDIDWALIGHNIEMPNTGSPPLWQAMTSLDFDDSGADIRDALDQAVAPDNPLFLPKPGGSPTGAWIFGAGFQIGGGLLDGKFLFQDRAYYGIAIGGGLLDEIFDGEFAASVVYIKATDPHDDSFAVSVKVPSVIMAGFTFLGGVIAVEVSMGGDFLLDVGFPWLNSGGGRQWDRAFGAIVSIGQGSGGVYIQKRHGGVAIVSDPTQPPTAPQRLIIGGGWAIQAGLGASFNAGVVQAWVTAGYYAILEGNFTLDGSKVVEVHISGAIGVLVRGQGELDWWIISVRLEITASAEARATLDWQQGHPTQLALDFEISIEVSAQACVGSGWFKICRGISVGLPMHFHQQIQIG